MWRSALIGERVDLAYPYEYLGAGPQTLREVLDGKQRFAGALRDAKRPLIVVGSAAAARPDGAAILAAAAKIAVLAGEAKELGAAAFNLLHAAASRVAGLDLGFVPAKGGIDMAAVDVAYLLGADELDMKALRAPFVVYQGSHGDAGAERADVVLPGAAYTEKSATYVNLEGRAQTTARAAFPPGDAKEDWTIVRALSAHAGHTLPYDTLSALRAAMYKSAPALAQLDVVEPAGLSGVEAPRCPRRQPGRRAVRRRRARLLSDQPDCTRLRRNGRAERAKEKLGSRNDGNAWLTSGHGRRFGRASFGRCW